MLGKIKKSYRRWKCRRHYNSLEWFWQDYYRQLRIDPESLIKKGQI